MTTIFDYELQFARLCLKVCKIVHTEQFGIIIQVETNPVPHLLLDVRSSEEIQDLPLPSELSFGTLHLSHDELDVALSGSAIQHLLHADSDFLISHPPTYKFGKSN